MVVLMEYAPAVGVAQKRKVAEEPGLFAWPGEGDVDGVPISCRANKMRRLECAGGTGSDVPEPASDVMMGEEPPAPSPGAAEGESAVVVYNHPAVDAGGAGGLLGLLGNWRIRPWAHVSDGAEWIRDMLREADSCRKRVAPAWPWSLGLPRPRPERRIRRPRLPRRWTERSRTQRERWRWTSRRGRAIIRPRRSLPAAARGTCCGGRSTAWCWRRCLRLARRARRCGLGELSTQ